jgi:PhzF family phenazine biosynthesis protein
MWLDNGPTWLGLLLDDERTVLGIEPDHAALKSLCKVGVVSPRRGEGDTSFEVRGFAAAIGINEDPVTGSLNASLAQWLIGADLAPAHYVAAQGTALGRVGRVYIDKIGDTVWVGGSSVNCIEGQLTL